VQYLYHKDAKVSSLSLIGDTHRYIFKVRRHKEGAILYLRNLQDDILYSYQIASLTKKEALLELQTQKKYPVNAKRELHIGWCIVDPKSIERVLPTLNELGVAQITFIYCQRSQKSFQVDFKRWEKIILNSSQQSGRSTPMRLNTSPTLKEFLECNPSAYLLNFSDNNLSTKEQIKTIVIGCEGGLTVEEIELFQTEAIVGLDTPLILKSESAVTAVASKILL